MKKTLAILGLLVCTTGITFADEAAQLNTEAPQQVEIQNQLNKQTFDKFNNNGQFKPNFEKQKDNIKYDKSVNNKHFKNGQPPKFDKNNRPDFKNGQPPKFDKNSRPDFKSHKPMSNRNMSHRKHPSSDFKPYHHNHQHLNNRNAHRPNMKNTHRANHKNIHKNINRKAYNKTAKRR